MKKNVVRLSLIHSSEEGMSLEIVSGRRKHAHQKIAKAVRPATELENHCSVRALVCKGRAFLPLSAHLAFLGGHKSLLCPVLRGPFQRQWGVVLTGDYRLQLKPDRAVVHVAATFSDREDAEMFYHRSRTRLLVPPSHIGYTAEQICQLFELSTSIIELMIDRNGVVLGAVPNPSTLHRKFFFLPSTDD